MTYKINGTELVLQPTLGRWVPRSSVGIDGLGHPVYPASREFEITWELVAPSDLNQLQGFFDTVVTTGTAVMDLPKYASATYVFESYTGCTLSEPAIGPFYTQHITSVTLLVANIIT